MSHIPTPASIYAAPADSRPLLEAVKSQLGLVPNMFRLISNSSAALEGYLSLNSALTHGRLDHKTRERLALAVAERNGCDYCLSAHSYLAANLAKLSAEEILANRNAASSDPKADAALRFAVKLVESRGHVDRSEISLLRQAGYDDGQIVEIIAHVALNTLTNYVNAALGTAIDFPAVGALVD